MPFIYKRLISFPLGRRFEYSVNDFLSTSRQIIPYNWCYEIQNKTKSSMRTSRLTYNTWLSHYNDVIMGAIASQITSLTIVYLTVYSDADQRKHQNSASLAFVRGMHRGPVNSPHKWPVRRKMFPFDEVIMSGHGIREKSFNLKCGVPMGPGKVQ